MNDPDPSRAYCADLTRRLDPDRYLAALAAPIDRRPALLALYAFNVEIARIRETVGEPALGAIRLQWWREAVAGGAPGNAVIAELAAAGVDRDALARLIDARETDLDDHPATDMAALESYAEATSGGLTALAFDILDVGVGIGDDAARRAARHVGIAWALVGLVRAVPFHARARRLYLPLDRLAAAGLGAEDVFALKPSVGLARVAADVADRAHAHLVDARAERARVPRAAAPALLTALLADTDLARLRRVGHDVFDPRLARRGIGRAARALIGAARGRF